MIKYYHLSRWQWGVASLVIAIVVGYLDWITGERLNFFVFYFIPVSIGAWFLGRSTALSLAIVTALEWSWVDNLFGHITSPFYVIWDLSIHLVAFISIGLALSKVRQLLDTERELSNDLHKSLAEIKVLEAFLPICCVCKKIRTETKEWEQIESYISKRTDTKFSHGYCPECAAKAFKEAGLDYKIKPPA
jgi:hypothetical protein